MPSITSLDPLSLPLHGSRLIEASAGTGKTFTIALLYVRLVLGGHSVDDDTAFIRPLTPPEILVVTFTNAATQELRERIRNRLVEAAEVFRAENVEGGADPLLLQLRDQYDPATWPACSRRLALAAEWMDEAAVSTIHSWCYRMLREHAFDSGSLFSLNLENDQRELEQEVVRDYWRSFYYPLDSDALGIVTRYWKSPDDLHTPLQRLLPESEALGDAKPEPSETLAATQAERAAQLSKLKAPWAAWLDELVPALEEAATRKAFKGQSFNAKSRANWLGALREWCETDADRPALTDAAWKRMTPDGMADIWKEGAPPCPQAWEALARLPKALDALPEPRNDLLIHAVQWCRARLEREQERRAEMGPNDLLTHLDRALKGPNKEALAAQIQRQFPVALIDEFQDTDPIQYRIFNAVYDVATPQRDSAILLIGDPKQAIYAFRGADIFTYLQARQHTEGRHVTLGTNFRSSQAMVAAVNHCFSYADQHDAGAFLFRADGGDNPLPFNPVNAKGTKETLVLNGQPLPAMTLWPLESDEPLSKTAYQTEMAERCASHMAMLLEAGRQQQAGFAKAADNSATGDSSVRSGEQSLTPLAPSDMAVLVNGLQEARAIRLALASRGIKSVYLSDHDKVFSSPIAPQLAIWLRACAEPQANSRQAEAKLRAALATSVIGLSLEELDHLNQSELAWEARVEQFSDYHRLWQRQGVLPLVRRLMVDFDIAARLLGEFAEGERLLTDLLHLGEMLQHASQELDGEHALIRFLAEAIADPDSHGDSHKLRLESDADLVKVVTIHKSKGLEYPLVFLPFIANHRPVSDTDLPLRWHDSDGTLQLSLSADEATLATADRERLGEDLRKLYVALTRARHATWLGLAPLKGSENSAIGHLINGGKAIAPSAFTHALDELVKGSDIALSTAPEPTALRFTPAPEQQALGNARTPLRPAREQWWIASYSALHTSGAVSETMPGAAQPTPAPEPTTPQEATTLEVLDEPHDNAINTEAFHLHRFPRGPGPGTFLHGLLEWAGQLGFNNALKDPAAREDMLRRRVQLRGWQAWHDTLAGWLEELLATPLPLPMSQASSQPSEGSQAALCELESYQVELEFWFAAHQVQTRKLDELVSDHLLPGVSRPVLDADTLNGMLKGFIDLAFEHEGRFYVLDWKSNYLGSDDSAYTADALRNAMLEKRYDLQAALYLLALHRLLKARLPDYDPHQHLGGSMTVFLRGSRTTARGVHAVPAPVALIEALDTLFTGTAAETAAPHQESIV
ncbi:MULTISPECIES: exodeoxyribonuclease V subunit beta [Halomonadaceae]|uniref:exodeoxyribonuclease V subunit beta n=1 Tax=Halomonadaceae TaxID=28256 RepID=UPI0012EFB101|nr:MULTISPECIES: exodeoxyribonuclease V subunit beta [Halomonas]CAD5248349.1 RecBCD enzyme subunit RecB [Halomonas sp. 59]CAD5248466.1 RecBCD enzyme subunit RecB [Halomonas sp. 113]CAD5251873.1 RecBCD enzyme subunit RecB [Halomonas sp. 156]CAD5256915.1 RecBCD enzyme subunit RecB [Halomonas sp. I3]VXC00176.1 RecBCD enzyme subunit RecB [Halomonas titanicae]